MRLDTTFSRAAVGLVLLGLAAAGTAAPHAPEEAAAALLTALEAGHYEEAVALFGPGFEVSLPAAQLEQVWRGLRERVGDVVRRGPSRVETEGEYRIVVRRLEFERAALDLRVTVDAVGDVQGLFFTPSSAPPADPTPSPPPPDARFVEREARIGEGAGALPGTLTLPRGDGPFPSVVLVHGSGPNDRDETIGAIKPFRDLAWGLAERGIAVLRYDKRTFARAGAVAQLGGDLTVREEVVSDAVAALRTLRGQPEVDAAAVFVLGHSLGGMLVPRILERAPASAGAILLAAPARPLPELLVEQVRYLSRLDGQVTEEERALAAELERQARRIRDLQPGEGGSELLMGVPAGYWLDLRGYDPPKAAALLPTPMLILQGGRDYQVTAVDFERWRKALGRRRDVVLRAYPSLNHLFVAGEGPSTPAEVDVEGHVDAGLLDDVAAWIREEGARSGVHPHVASSTTSRRRSP